MSGTSGSSEATGSGYLNTGPSAATFIQLASSGTHVSAVIDTATLSGPAPHWAVSGNQITASGSESGSNVTFTINGVVATGQLTPRQIILDIPQRNGSLSAVHFVAASTEQYDAAVAKLRAYAVKANADFNYATSYANHLLAQQCRAAGGRISVQSTDPYVISSCVVAGVDDAVQDADTGGAAFQFAPSAPARAAKRCSAIGGEWRSVALGGYFTGQTGWDCVIRGFQDQVASFSNGAFDVPLADAPRVVALMDACTHTEGDFGLNSAGTAFSCLVNGTTYDDLELSPHPHYVTPLAVAEASGTSGSSGASGNYSASGTSG